MKRFILLVLRNYIQIFIIKVLALFLKNEFLQKNQQFEKEIYELKDQVNALKNEKSKLETKQVCHFLSVLLKKSNL